jgi:hypothetical protein
LATTRSPAELAAFGFTWFAAADPAPLRAFLDDPDPAVLEGNAEVARRHFSMDALTGQAAPPCWRRPAGTGCYRSGLGLAADVDVVGLVDQVEAALAVADQVGEQPHAAVAQGGGGLGVVAVAHSARPRPMPSVISACSRRNRVTRLARRGAFSRISW